MITEATLALEPEARRRLVRLIIFGSVAFLGCAAAKLFIAPVLAILFFSFTYLQRRLDPIDTLVVILAVEPWLGPFRFFGFGFDFDRAFVVLALATVWSANGPWSRRFLSNKLDVALFVFLFACALSAACSFMYRTPLRVLIGSLLVPFGYYLVAKNCVRRPDLLPKLYLATVIAILGFGTLAIVEGVIKIDILTYGEHEVDPFRVNGPMRMGEDFGLCINLLLLFFLGMRSVRRKTPVSSVFLWVLPPLGIVSCYLTLTRGIWISLVAGWLVQVVKRDFWLFLRVTLALAITLWLAFKVIMPAVSPDVFEKRLNNERTLNARIATYQSAWAMFKDYPILGVGFAAFNDMSYRDRYHFEYKGEVSVDSPHNNFMALLSETGLLGTLCFLFFLFQAFRSSLRVAKQGHSDLHFEYGVFVCSAIVAYLVVGMGLHIIRNNDFINKYFFIFLGILSGMIDDLGQKRS